MPEAIRPDSGLEATMAKCLNLESPTSFFLYAGAGTGKTRALIEAMKRLQCTHGAALRQSGQKVAVITYTNAARDVIRSRIAFDPIFAVSTIHSFAWQLIRSFHTDIACWIRHNLTVDLEELEAKQAKSKKVSSKAYADRTTKIESKRKRLLSLASIREFTYNPNGENIGKNSLNHVEVISIAASFLMKRPLMRQVLIQRHPALLIDESQDTQKDLLDALFYTQSLHADQFCLGLFGDTMQRIYTDGKERLDEAVPESWAKPALKINYRCPRRIVALLNKIRTEADGADQEPKDGATEGIARLFLVEQVDGLDRTEVEARVVREMAAAAADDGWLDNESVKLLTLEHHMAARRGGFDSFFEPLYRIGPYKTGLLDGTLSGVAFMTQQVFPLIQAAETGDRFRTARVVKDHSPLLSRASLIASESALANIGAARESVEALLALWGGESEPSLMVVLEAVTQTGLFVVPEVLAPLLQESNTPVDPGDPEADPVDDPTDPAMDAWREALQAPFSQLRAYVEYVSDRSRFGTHQGIKGLQFPRVMVILDDEEARGGTFSYEKLLGVKGPTAADDKNRSEGKETSIDRTRRLFYVTCSRAERSLAVVVYTMEPKKVADRVKELGWFQDDEVVEL